jgi:hypothetical protein
VHGPGAGTAARSSSPRGARTSIYRGGCSVTRSVCARARAHVRDARVQAALADSQGVYVRAEHRQPVPGRANHVSQRLVGNRPRSRCSSAPREPGAGPCMIVYAELAGTAERLQRAVRGAAGTEALAERPLARVVRVRARRAGHRAPRRCRTRRARAAEPSRSVRARARSRVLSGPRGDGAHTRGRSRERPLRPLRAFRQPRARAGAGAPDADAVFFALSLTDADDADGAGERAPSVSVQRRVLIARAGVACSTHLSLAAREVLTCSFCQECTCNVHCYGQR